MKYLSEQNTGYYTGKEQKVNLWPRKLDGRT